MDVRQSALRASRINSQRKREQYRKTPKRCPACSTQLPYPKRKNRFCNHSCAASFNRNRKGTARKPPQCKCCNAPTKGRPGRSNVYCESCITQKRHLHRKALKDLKTDASRRVYLLRTRSHRCEGCNRKTWRGAQIPLEMDHIDGDPTHNEETNLQLVCPNCHALSPFHRGANRGRGRTQRRRANVAQLVQST